MFSHSLHAAVEVTLARMGIGVGELCNLGVDDVDVNVLPNREWSSSEMAFLRLRYGGEIPYNKRRKRKTTT